MNHVFHPDAAREFEEAVGYYHARGRAKQRDRSTVCRPTAHELAPPHFPAAFLDPGVAESAGRRQTPGVTKSIEIEQAKRRLLSLARSRHTVSLRHHDETVAFLVPRDRMEALLETMELMANPEAMRAIQRDQSGKGKYHPLSVLDGV